MSSSIFSSGQGYNIMIVWNDFKTMSQSWIWGRNIVEPTATQWNVAEDRILKRATKWRGGQICQFLSGTRTSGHKRRKIRYSELIQAHFSLIDCNLERRMMIWIHSNHVILIPIWIWCHRLEFKTTGPQDWRFWPVCLPLCVIDVFCGFSRIWQKEPPADGRSRFLRYQCSVKNVGRMKKMLPLFFFFSLYSASMWGTTSQICVRKLRNSASRLRKRTRNYPGGRTLSGDRGNLGWRKTVFNFGH